MAGTINNMMSGINQPVQGNITPPPINSPMYNVAVNGQPTGPFDTVTLGRMATMGELSRETLVWSQGMAEWMKASEVEGLKGLFADMPPIPKTDKDNN